MITLITDFGDSEYVGALKGVIYSICPGAKVVDITHNIKRFDVRHAAFVVHSTTKYFPKGTVHCVVVDPGVGTERKSVMVKTKDHTYIGPDNGVFTFIKNIDEVYEITIPSKSKTFHGRDVFCKIAAKIECGSKAEEFGKKTSDVKRLEITTSSMENGMIIGEVIYADHFGNVITNIMADLISEGGTKYNDVLQVKIGGAGREVRFVESYGFAGKGEVVCLIGSAGYLEFAVNRGSAEKALNVRGDEKVMIKVCEVRPCEDF